LITTKINININSKLYSNRWRRFKICDFAQSVIGGRRQHNLLDNGGRRGIVALGFLVAMATT
jgi:hypothetical protein